MKARKEGREGLIWAEPRCIDKCTFTRKSIDLNSKLQYNSEFSVKWEKRNIRKKEKRKER